MHFFLAYSISFARLGLLTDPSLIICAHHYLYHKIRILNSAGKSSAYPFCSHKQISLAGLLVVGGSLGSIPGWWPGISVGLSLVPGFEDFWRVQVGS